MAGYTDSWAAQAITQGYLAKPQIGIEFSYLTDALNQLSAVAKSKIAAIRSKKSAMSIADMFDLQMTMNKLSQFSEMSTSVISATNTACNSIARNVK